jgi:hypothetical protein
VDDGSPAWSSDGKTIFYRSYVKGMPLLFSIPAAGGTPGQLTNEMSGAPRVSVDGTKILVQVRPTALGAGKLYLIGVNGGPPEKIFNVSSGRYQWAGDGASFLFLNGLVDNAANLWRQPMDPALPPVQLTKWKTDRIYAFCLSRDGRTAAVARGRSVSDVVLIGEVDSRQ